MSQRKMLKLVTTGDISVSKTMIDRLFAASIVQRKSINLVADEAINRALDALEKL